MIFVYKNRRVVEFVEKDRLLFGRFEDTTIFFWDWRIFSIPVIRLVTVILGIRNLILFFLVVGKPCTEKYKIDIQYLFYKKY